MDMSMERDSSALGSLFQQIINDMKNTSPLWEDFVAKASKLHACLKAAIQAIASYLDAFQKIADAATNSRGASKEIGTALTRVCLRHKAVETRLKTFTAAIMDCLVQPLQEKLEDWKRSVAMIDKEHAKEYKRCRTELKKRSTDTLRLQKKARKGQSDNLQSLMDSHMQDVTLRRAELEEVEKKSLRSAMIEERMRYCNFVHLLQPVVKEECEVMSELGHLQEAMQSIALVTKEPHVLPPASEELIHDAKASITLYPESPSTSGGGGGSLSQGGCSNSLGSRKSSVCSISSMNSSGSSNSPGHPHYQRSLSQYISPSMRLKPGESSDSGFCSSPALTTQASSIANPSHAVTTWPTHSQDAVDLAPNATDRPHTISSAYEKGHQRPPLTVYTFQNPETIHEGGIGGNANGSGGTNSGQNTPSTQKSPGGALNRPPLPVRCSSLERPLVASNNRGNGPNIMQRQCPSPIPAHVTKELAAHLAQQQHLQQQQQQSQQQATAAQQLQQQQSSPPTYVNMSELANMAAMKQQQQQQSSSSSSPPTSTVHQNQQHQQQAVLQQQHSIDSISSIHSNDSNQSAALQQQQHQQPNTPQHPTSQQTPPPIHQHPTTTQRSQSSSSMTPSLHSHPSIDSTSLATPSIGQTPTHSSGSSTPQNHYSPLLNNSLSSTAAGTPSGSSIASGNMSLSGGATSTGAIIAGNGSGNNSFVYNVCSPTPPLSANSSQASDILKITENEGNGVAMQQQQTQPETAPSSPPTAATTTNNNSSNNISETNIAQTQPPLNANTINTSSSSSSTKTNSQDNSNSNSANINDADTLSSSTSSSGAVVENDERSRASVLQKASMFEKQAAAAKNTPIPSSSSSSVSAGAAGARHSPIEAGIYGTRTAITTNNHHHHSAQQTAQPIDPQDVDKCFEDSLQELNNLIGELDSFQREIDASKEQQKQQQQQQQSSASPQQLQKNVKNLFDGGLDAFNCNETMTIITDDTTTTIICESQHTHHHPGGDKDFCTASNQTNSSGCGTDISDTTSEDCNADTRSLTSQTGGVVLKTNLKSLSGGAYNSDSELSRCYVSETSSIMGGAGDGYENPTFAHFAVSSTSGSQCYDDNRSDTISLQRHGIYGDNLSDSGSNVVVIYDHQPPMTPDIDYAKQNSEIVMLRTKPQQYPLGGQYDQQEMRELQQLPANLTELPLSPTDSPDHHPQHVATVQPAKQRLSSFRASSEQLQLLNSPSTPTSTKGSTRIARRSSVNTAKPPPPIRRSSSVTPSPNTPTTPTNASTTNLLHQQAHSLNTSTENLPPPPAYLLDGRQTTMLTNNHQQPPPPPVGMPSSSLKVSDTVKALSAGLRHQPASPQTLRRLQQQQQAQQMATSPPPPVLPSATQSMLQQPRQYHHQYTKSSPVLLSPTSNKKSRTPTPPTPPPLNRSLIVTDLDETPPPLPPPNPPNHQNQQQQHYSTNHHNHQQQSPQLRYHQQQQPQPHQLPSVQQQMPQHSYYDNNGETVYGSKSPTSFRTSSPGGIYAQPKILNNMSSFRTNSPGPNNGHQTPTSTTQSHVPAQPKTNPNLIAQLNARLNSKQQNTSGGSNSNEAAPIYGVSQAHTRESRSEDIYMRNYGQQQQQQMSPHVSQQQQTYDAAGHHHQSQASATANHHQQQQQRQQPLSQSPAHQASHYQSGGHHPPSQQQQQQQHYTCPPPLEDPPPPPIHSNNNSATMPKRSSNHHHQHNQQLQQVHPTSNLASYAAASSSATLPRNLMQQQQRLHLQQQHQQQQSHYGTTQAAQQQQYHAPAAISGGHQQDQQRPQQQYQAPQNISQRPPMPLPHQSSSQQQQQQYQAPAPPAASTGSNRQRTISSSSLASNKQQQQQQPPLQQPPIPSRHSSVQQKIFVATNPFIQTTTIHCQSPGGASSVHSQPASPICNSPTPSSIASIYGTSGRRSSGTATSVGGGNSSSGGVGGGHYDSGNGGSIYYNHHPHHHQPQTTFTTANTNYTSTNTGMTRAKAKAEFLENLNQKLAKQSLSGRAFAVRNLINSKALPDPRICHESLMDQIKRGATLKRNQKINDRSAPKIY